MEKKIFILGKYLITKGIDNPLRFQKMLFFLRVNEVKQNNNIKSYFEEKDNFEAWIYGPVNTKTYNYFKNFFWGLDEKDSFILEKKEEEELDEIYLNWFNEWNKKDTNELVMLSHKNLAWLDARNDLDHDKPSNNLLKEDEKLFFSFKE